ncbi:anti-sigma factor [Trinickia caryophylli]|uniref:Transmembrane transcriptional regulator (Anti-sigma factor RsiW) n=1 Tax=Trinickia caryophylli TaxID=28094 RepID=A0A1X7FRF4_TRICW|nr:anti-sigma factor [Trinickia caryophylli]PMS11989.1 transcriptional regulator [Trinickia caryophylli]TRX13931.1 anti-sigma factor [Trinickia caryophylli]WQE15527.1 anti-sigma factor [Trinickia caryophylli]SMF57400.1 Transmembrane transcriptional regulator (anti-sigma factor RsiW) [Trinickia caryophylli]GLU33724.1 membrane protein [Trinickia caryophylli]
MKDQRDSIGDEQIHAYVDGTLGETERAEVEQAIARDPALAQKVNDYFSLNAMLHERYDRVLTEPVPKRLRRGPARHPRAAANWPRFAGLAAELVIGVGIGMGLGLHLGKTSAPTVATADPVASPAASQASPLVTASVANSADAFAQRAAIAHVVYMPAVDRPSSVSLSHEQDFVQWLSAKLGTDIHPPALARSGFELMGGRLLHDGSGTTAMFMYRDAEGQRVTLCVSRRKQGVGTTAFKLYRDGPVNVFYWVDGDFGYAISSGIGRDALLDLAHDVYEQVAAPAKG